MTWIDEVLTFWFDTLRPADWWRADPATDAAVAERFADLHALLRRDPPDADALDARGSLATVIALDQFTRHLHRGTAAAYATDAFALCHAHAAVDAGRDRSMRRLEKQFLYMPFMHAEDLATQQRSLCLFEALGDRDALRSALHHHAQIARFGRFPARNAALGRRSTDDETAWLTTIAAARAHRPRP